MAIQVIDASGAVKTTPVADNEVTATYRYSVTQVTPVATPQDFLRIQGSSTKTIRVKKLYIGGLATTLGTMQVNLIRRSTAGTIGSGAVTAITAAKHDPNKGSPTATVNYVQTANWTTEGTSAGQLGSKRLTLAVAATSDTKFVQWDFCQNCDQPVLVRGTSDWLCVNLGGDAVPAGGKLDIEIETEEDAS
jgi:hypothetical protein